MSTHCLQFGVDLLLIFPIGRYDLLVDHKKLPIIILNAFTVTAATSSLYAG